MYEDDDVYKSLLGDNEEVEEEVLSEEGEKIEDLDFDNQTLDDFEQNFDDGLI